MNFIYHEKQEGSLCGQHCLNNLLQENYFTAVDLAELALKMDSEEREFMSELGTHTEDYQRFLEQPSSNVDDSGMFSIQVLAEALKVWNLALVPYASSAPLAVAARDSAIDQQAYICNFREHWFTIRKLGNQWFNLNSLLTFPELISNTYLALFLIQLQHENYSIFVVEGQLPHSDADEALKKTPAVQTIKPQLLSELSKEDKISEEDQLRAALSASLKKANKAASSSSSAPESQSEEDILRRAIEMSLQQDSSESSSEDIERAIRLSLEATSQGSPRDTTKQASPQPSISKENQDLEKALQTSLDESLCTVEVPDDPLEEDSKDSPKKKQL